MSWDAIAAIGELVAAVAVVASLIYLSRQLRSANRQSEVAALRHIADSMNKVSDLMGRDLETAGIVNRGRQDLGALNNEELLVFTMIHIRLLNTMESWFTQIDRTSSTGESRSYHVSNISQVAAAWLGYPGTRVLWSEVQGFYKPISEVVEGALRTTLEDDNTKAPADWDRSILTSD